MMWVCVKPHDTVVFSKILNVNHKLEFLLKVDLQASGLQKKPSYMSKFKTDNAPQTIKGFYLGNNFIEIKANIL